MWIGRVDFASSRKSFTVCAFVTVGAVNGNMDGRIESGAFVSRLMLYAVTGGTGIAVQGAKWFFARAQGERASTGRRMVFIVVRVDMILVLGVIAKGRSSC